MQKNILEYLENSAKNYPEKIAFVDNKKTYTYSEMINIAKSIGSKTASISSIKQPVAILMEKSTDCLAAFFGVVYAGCFYVPLDSKAPIERIRKIISNLNPICIIYDTKNKAKAEELNSQSSLLDFNDICHLSIDEDLLSKIRNNQIDTDLLYVLFTSGSTGDPKGVTICHKSVIDYTEWLAKTLKFSHDTILGNQAPFYFDNSILDIYTTLKFGATMHIIPQICFSFPKSMVKYLNGNKINTIFWVPFALITVANSGILGKEELPYLNNIYFCGEVMPCKQLNIWRKALPNAMYVNMYGPTEITDVCTYYIVNREFNDNDSLPIGIPCENTRIIILDENDSLVNGDGKGELCVVGTSLSLGYYNNIEKTQAAFVQNPLNKSYIEYIYRTGDIVKYNEYGEIMYLSRKDFQIKHLGYRIELGEIETELVAINEIENGCCIYDDTNKKIVCFYIGNIEENTISKMLSNSIPSYMVPEIYHHLDVLPQTGNGKIDRVTLKRTYIG